MLVSFTLSHFHTKMWVKSHYGRILRPFCFNYAKLFAYVKKKQYFCTRLGASNEPVAICDQL